MPPLSTYHDGKNIYSVDMMMAYINTSKHPVVKVPVDTFIPLLKEKVWGKSTPEWAPMTVIEKMDVKKYKVDSDRIHKADLSYPIIVTGINIVDGYHRIAKAYLEGRKEINAYIFDKTLMKKFIINKDLNFVKAHQTSIHDILELWTKRFC